MAEPLTELSQTLFRMLQTEKLVLLNTIDHETGSPSTSAISWVFAPDSNTIRFAIDHRSRIVTNVKENHAANMTLFSGGTIHTVYGQIEMVREQLEDVPFRLSCLDLKIEVIRDAMFYGSQISVEPEYEKTYDKRAAEKLDNQVFAAMKKCDQA